MRRKACARKFRGGEFSVLFREVVLEIDLCKNTVCVLNSFNVTIIKQFNIKTFYPPKGKKHRRQSCSDKTAHSSHGWVKNKRFVSMDSTNDSNSLELEVHKGTGVYISICLLGSVRQVIKIWLPRRL